MVVENLIITGADIKKNINFIVKNRLKKTNKLNQMGLIMPFFRWIPVH